MRKYAMFLDASECASYLWYSSVCVLQPTSRQHLQRISKIEKEEKTSDNFDGPIKGYNNVKGYAKNKLWWITTPVSQSKGYI